MKKRLSKFNFLIVLFMIQSVTNIAQSGGSIFDTEDKTNNVSRAFLEPFSFEFVFATTRSYIKIEIKNGREITNKDGIKIKDELIDVKENHLLKPVCYKSDKRFWQTLFENFLKQNSDVKDAGKSFKDQTCFATRFSDKQIIQVGKHQLEILCSNEFNGDTLFDNNIEILQNIKNFSSISDFAIYVNNIFKRTLIDSINAENMWKRLEQINKNRF